jgi:hypothetical protein
LAAVACAAFDLAGAPAIIGEASAITPAHRGRPPVAQEAERKAQGVN